MSKRFEPGLNIKAHSIPLGFSYGAGVDGPVPEIRTLDAIRRTLRDPECVGPEQVYAIAMDVCRAEDRADLSRRHLLYGVVTYAAGKLGREPVRSQGHIHRLSPRANCSTPEVYEIWAGTAIILMQEQARANPGRCFAVTAQVGEVVIVPPGWAHATISADSSTPLTFGAFCDRAYGFEYDALRELGGMAFFPVFTEQGELAFEHNDRYAPSALTQKTPEVYEAFELGGGDGPIYAQYVAHRDRFDFVPNPNDGAKHWVDFVP